MQRVGLRRQPLDRRDAAPSTATASTVQLFTEPPSTSTTQAPHWLVSQPTCVPVSERLAQQIDQQRGGLDVDVAAPLRVKLTFIRSLLGQRSTRARPRQVARTSRRCQGFTKIFVPAHRRRNPRPAGVEHHLDERALVLDRGTRVGTTRCRRPPLLGRIRPVVAPHRELDGVAGRRPAYGTRMPPRRGANTACPP